MRLVEWDPMQMAVAVDSNVRRKQAREKKNGWDFICKHVDDDNGVVVTLAGHGRVDAVGLSVTNVK